MDTPTPTPSAAVPSGGVPLPLRIADGILRVAGAFAGVVMVPFGILMGAFASDSGTDEAKAIAVAVIIGAPLLGVLILLASIAPSLVEKIVPAPRLAKRVIVRGLIYLPALAFGAVAFISAINMP